MLRVVLIALLFGSVCAFWGADSEDFGDLDNYRDSYRDSRDDFGDSYTDSFGDDYRDDQYDNDSDDYYNRLKMNRFRTRSTWQQRPLGFQLRRRQSRFRSGSTRSRNTVPRTQRVQNPWRSSRRQRQRSSRQSHFSSPTQTFRRSSQTLRPQGNFFGGNNLAQAAMMYNMFDMF